VGNGNENRSESGVRRAHSTAPDAREAVRELQAALAQPALALVCFFCSGEHDLGAVEDELRSAFPGTPVVGCTTAGEIGPAGYREHSLSGVSFSAQTFSAVTGRLEQLQRFDSGRGQALVGALLEGLQGHPGPGGGDNGFGLLLIDGLSVREEPVARALQHALGKVPLIGGSAGDGLAFGRTRVYHQGRFHQDAAVLALVTTRFPVRPFMTQHFVASPRRVVVTEADAEHRVVREIDGRPAAEAYAKLLGVEVGQLGPAHFAASPMVVVIGGVNYVRSISKARPDGSLKFFCAIEEGIVMRVARGADLVANLERTFATLCAEIGEPRVVLGCDCILRRLEIVQGGMVERVAQVLERHRVVGFATYGEQFRGVHVNQTFTGVAIGGAGPEALDA
jgi:hypothetical protein